MEQKRKQESTELRVSYNAPSYRSLQSGFGVHEWSLTKKGLSFRDEGRALTKMPPTALYSRISHADFCVTIIQID